MPHLYACPECHALYECAGSLCRDLEHRCLTCRKDRPRYRPSGDVISEKPWPTRMGATAPER